MGIFHTIAHLADQANPLAKSARKQGGVIGSIYNIADPGSAVSHKIANGAPMSFRTLYDPNNWTGANPDKPLADMSAEEQEAERQKRISANVAAVSKAYGGREQQYADFANALKTKYTGDLNRQYEGANRNLKFELAGSGLTGGSQAADSGQALGREMAQGTITAQGKVNDAEAALRGQDEQARLQMTSLAQAGGDIGDASSQTANLLKANLQGAQGSTAGALGDVFGSTAATYKTMQDARNLRRGLTSSYEQIYGSGLGRAQPTR